MSLSHEEVVRRFSEQQTNRDGRVEWRGARVYSTHYGHPTLYSHGSHFVLAYYLGQRDGEHLYLKNGDRYSISTSTHQGYVQQYCKGPTIPFSALNLATIAPSDVRLEHVVDVQADTAVNIVIDEDGVWENDHRLGYHYEDRVTFDTPEQGMFVEMRRDGKTRYGFWHLLGGAVLHYKDAFYLCALDENSYFLSQLPEPAWNVGQAFESLKPIRVRAAEEIGIEILRQGEWFFIPTELSDRELADKLGIKTLKELRKHSKQKPLPYENSGSNRHVTKWAMNGIGGAIYAKGAVYHRDPWGNGTGEHTSVLLGNVWHEAVRNTAIQSWSVGGSGARFD